MNTLSILGAGRLGGAIATGLAQKGLRRPADILLTRRQAESLAGFAQMGFATGTDNMAALAHARLILLTVLPQQLNGLLAEIRPGLVPGHHILISVVTGASISDIRNQVGPGIEVVRAMPNTAISIGESMTCLARDGQTRPESLEMAQEIFDALGTAIVIQEEEMTAATALCACGIAFFMRAIRAASQGGIEIGFHAEEALRMAAQTAKGAASLILAHGNHPEYEIDHVTTPRGCTIAGLNQMEHNGFSSAMIRGIVTSAEKAAKLYQTE